MQRIGGALAFALTTIMLVALLALTSRREVTPLDPSLSAVQIWQQAQATQQALTSYSTSQKFTMSYVGGETTETSDVSIDHASGQAWMRGYGSRVGSLPAPATQPPAEVQAQGQAVVAATSAALGLAPGEQVTEIDLYYDLSTRTAYARANGHPWNRLSDDLWQRFGFADEVKPYDVQPTPVDLALAGTTSFDGAPACRLTYTDNGRSNEALIDGDFHIVETTASAAADDGQSLQTVTRYSDFDEAVAFPADAPR